MNAAGVLMEAHRRGIELRLSSGDRICYRGPKGALDRDLREAIQARRAKIIELLRGPFAELAALIRQAAPYRERVLDERPDLRERLVAAEDLGDVDGVRESLEAIVAAFAPAGPPPLEVSNGTSARELPTGELPRGELMTARAEHQAPLAETARDIAISPAQAAGHGRVDTPTEEPQVTFGTDPETAHGSTEEAQLAAAVASVMTAIPGSKVTWVGTTLPPLGEGEAFAICLAFRDGSVERYRGSGVAPRGDGRDQTNGRANKEAPKERGVETQFLVLPFGEDLR